ncbi:MAG: serine/threonine-protein kinase [Thermoanaerobaculia bacterium]
MIGLLGRGGMGEVYRADDLKLGQPVALKFLPAQLAGDPERLALLVEEVRTARRVAHPNVCRVYDIGEADGQHFLSMEYVDGEDLGALLVRIGRLPGDKAAQLGRQLCAGLAAAHELGIVHRDLKPANVMIDGRGRARITDFGLARQTGAVEGTEAGQGTPAYMAPEQLAGRKATVQSDLYALGLVLYELFTGRRPFEARSLAEALDERSSGLPSRPSSHVDHLDPAVERAVLRCLEPEPDERPGSALAVAAALPGGDPLAAALAAGETPSPDIVAAAPSEATLKPSLAVAGVALSLVVILAGQWLEHRYLLAPPGRPPVVLADRAAEILLELGHSTEGGDAAWGYGRPLHPSARPLFDRQIAEAMTSGDAPPYYVFWYRSAPRPIMAGGLLGVSPNDPPRGTPGSVLVTLATDGRLLGLEARLRSPMEPSGRQADWDSVLELAGLEASELVRVDDAPTPPMYATEVAAWEGVYPAGMSRRVEAASTAGRLVWLRIFSPDLGDPGLISEALPEVFLVLLWVLFLLTLGSGIWLARANLHSGRGDRRGAWRISLFVGGTWLVGMALGADHAPALGEFMLWYQLLASALFVGAITGILYLGLEPLLRRNWPHRIIAWSRALEGRFKDPLVGFHLFVSAVVTALAVHLGTAGLLGGQALGLPSRVWTVLIPAGTGWQVADVLGVWPQSVAIGTLQALGFAVLLLLLVKVARSELLGGLLFVALMLFGLALRDQITDPGLLIGLAAQLGLMAWVLLRFGLFAFAASVVLSNLVFMYPTTQFGVGWTATGSTALALTIPAVAAWGAWVCTRAVRRRTEPTSVR